MTQNTISRRGLLQGATLTLGAAALLQQTFRPTPAQAQSGDLPAGTIHSFATGGVTFHTYVSPAEAVHVTAHIVEFDDQLKASVASHWGMAKYKKKRDKQIAAVQAELAKHWVDDQAARRVYIASRTEDKTGAEYWLRRLAASHTSLTDDRATEYMRGLLEEYDWIDSKRFGKRISNAAWLLMQHADDHLWDRVAVNSGRKQRYGTQPTWECTPEGNLTLQPMEDPDNVNRRRKKMGLGSVEKALEGMAKSVCG